MLRLYLLCVFVYLLHSAGVRCACRLLAFCLIIYFQVFWSGILLLYKQVLPKCFLLFVLKKCFLPRNTFLLRINLSFDFTSFKVIWSHHFPWGLHPSGSTSNYPALFAGGFSRQCKKSLFRPLKFCNRLTGLILLEFANTRPGGKANEWS